MRLAARAPPLERPPTGARSSTRTASTSTATRAPLTLSPCYPLVRTATAAPNMEVLVWTESSRKFSSWPVEKCADIVRTLLHQCTGFRPDLPPLSIDLSCHFQKRPRRAESPTSCPLSPSTTSFCVAAVRCVSLLPSDLPPPPQLGSRLSAFRVYLLMTRVLIAMPGLDLQS